MAGILDAVYKPRQEAFEPLGESVGSRLFYLDMPNPLISRINERLEALKLSPRAASLRVSTNADLIRGVLRAGEGANPTQDTVAKIAVALETTPEYLLGRISSGNGGAPADEIVRAAVRYPATRDMPADLGVMGTAAGSIIEQVEGFQYFSDMPVDFVRRPPALARVPEAYAIYVSGDSMWPMHPAGDLRFVNPARPAAIGDSVVLRTQHWEHDPGQLYIKILAKRTPDFIVVEQLNPHATIQIPRRFVDYIHHVMTMAELFGV
jgi:phage repressor protein C with HTH and peptisase S24 domain